jgi:hypothetical protein
MTFITLTHADSITDVKYHINVNKINYMIRYHSTNSPGVTWIKFNDNETEIKVKETPEEIMTIIYLVQKEK